VLGGLPGDAAVGRAGEERVFPEGEAVEGVEVLAVAGVVEAVPDDVGVVRVRRVGGDRLLVVGQVDGVRAGGRLVVDQGGRGAPGAAAVGGPDHQDGGVAGGAGGGAGGREGEGRGVDGAVGGGGHPRVGVAAERRVGDRGVEAGDGLRRGPGGAGGVTGVVGEAGDDGAGAADAAVAVLLPDGDGVSRVGGVHGDLGLDLAVEEHGP